MASMGATPVDLAIVPPGKQQRSGMRVAQAVPRLSVVIVNYRQWPYTAALTRQLLAAHCARRGEAEVVIVDNHSPSHPLVGRLRRWPGVSLRRWGRNRGFARAVNEGCRLGRGEWLLLLNPDMTVEPDFLDRALVVADQLIESEPRAGIVGFRLQHSDGSRQLSTGSFPTLLRTLLGLAWPRASRKYSAVKYPTRCQVPWVTGCCLLVRRACWQDLQGLDEEFFLYYEDVDLCRRARERGWSVWYEPQLSAMHHHPLHLRLVPPGLRLVTRHSLLTYAAKHWPAWQVPLLASVVRLEAWLRRWWARRRGAAETAAVYEELASLSAEMAHGHTTEAFHRLTQFVRRQEHLGSAVPTIASPTTADTPSLQAPALVLRVG